MGMNSTVEGKEKTPAAQIKVADETPESQPAHAEKRKADTDCQNAAFLQTLKDRLVAPAKSFHVENMRMLRSMSSGRPPKERLNIPEGVDVFQYGNQKLNIWEFQKEQMRVKIA